MNALSEAGAATTQGKKWRAMNSFEKMTFLAKICIMLVSSGFIFGNVFVE